MIDVGLLLLQSNSWNHLTVWKKNDLILKCYQKCVYKSYINMFK